MTAGINPSQAIKQHENNTITLTIHFPQPTVNIIKETQQCTHQITMKDLTFSECKKNYELPVKSLRILLPYGKTIDSIHLTTSEMLPISIKHFECPNMSNRFTQNLSNLYSTEGIHNKKGFQILYLNLYPVQYEPRYNRLYYYQEITVQIETIDSSPLFSYRGLTKDKQDICSLVENPETLSTYPKSSQIQEDQRVSYIIITNESFRQSPLEYNFDYLAYTKNQQGLSTEIYTVEEIIQNPAYAVNGSWGDNNPSNPFIDETIRTNFSRFDDNSARIRNFIRYAYMELGTEYVLLAGDADITNSDENIIPTRGLFANESGLPLINSRLSTDEEEADIPSDVYYACLDGHYNDDMDEHFGECADRNQYRLKDEADLLSEISVGRACVDSYEEITHFVRKTLHYQSMKDESYLSKILFAGEYLGFPGISAYGGNYKDVVSSYIPETYNIDTLYDRDIAGYWNKEDIISIINHAPPHLINHDGHSYYGYNLKMYNSDVDRLKNNQLFFLYSHGCMAGGFDNPLGYDCFAERLTVETQHGAFAAIMNARYGLGSEDNLQSPSLALDVSFFKALYNESIREIGPANHYSKEDHVWHIDDNGIRWVYYETNLFGDPALAIYDASDLEITLTVDITHPKENGFIYLFDKQLFRLPFLKAPLIIGDIIILVEANSEPAGYVYGVEFLLDNVSYFFDDEPPFEWKLDRSLKGRYDLTIIVYSYAADTYSTSLVFHAYNRG